MALYCVLQKERKLTFAKFETLGGRGATRKWRTSIMALPDGPGDLVVPRTMPLGELLRKLNTDTMRIGEALGMCSVSFHTVGPCDQPYQQY